MYELLIYVSCGRNLNDDHITVNDISLLLAKLLDQS